MPKLQLSLLCTTVALLSTSLAQAQATLTPLPGFGTNGWVAPGASPYVSTGNTERGIAYNPATGNLVLVARQNVGGIANNVRILSGTTGADLAGLDNTGVAGGTFPVNMVGVADDGAIYVGNLSTSATAPFKVYKWDSEATGTTTPPTVAYDAVTGLARTGDAFAVTGGAPAQPAKFAAAGTTTVDNSNFAVGSLDGLNTTNAYLNIAGTTTTSNDYRLALTFVDANTLIGNQGANARLTSFDPVAATVVATIPLGGAARRAMDYAIVGGRPVLAVADSNSSQVTVFDLSDPTAPVVLAQGNNTVAPLTANPNGSGAVAWGAITGNSAVLYAMVTNQGIQAFQFDLSPLASTTVFGVGCDGLALGASGVPAFGNAGFELSVINVPAVSPVAFVAFGALAIDPGFDLTAIGMPGCFGHTSLDLGLYATAAVVGGVGSYALPIPNNPSLAGATLAAQGVSFSLSTPLLLASSNGIELLLGF